VRALVNLAYASARASIQTEGIKKVCSCSLLKYDKIESGGSLICGASSGFLPCPSADVPSFEGWPFFDGSLVASPRGRRKLWNGPNQFVKSVT
jgi:hypothetical protein